jgi:ABC-type uncharacterized transport system auxiliary subunit
MHAEVAAADARSVRWTTLGMTKRLTFSATLVLMLAACHEQRGATGTYRLLEVNGSGLPAPGSRHTRGHAEIVDGAFLLQADGFYRARLVFRVTSDTVVYLDSAVHSGRYVRRRDSLIFRAASSDQVNAAGQLVGSALTFRYPGWTFVYRR